MEYLVAPIFDQPTGPGNTPWSGFPDYPDIPSEPSCKLENEIRKLFSTGSDTKIETLDKFRYYTPSLGHPKVKAKTEYFRYKDFCLWEGWTRGRTTLTAGLTQEEKFDCSGEPFFREDMKTEKRHKVKEKWTWLGPQTFPGPKVMDEMLYGTHKRRQDVTKIIDFYDGDVN